ncbi:MAG: hypothetical protein LEGION0398_MBIBDBAK_01002 [Legionellaceae bacterium]
MANIAANNEAKPPAVTDACSDVAKNKVKAIAIPATCCTIAVDNEFVATIFISFLQLDLVALMNFSFS